MEQSKLIEKLANDAEFVKKASSGKDADALVALAKENGYEISKEISEKILEMLNSEEGELNVDELESVAGGRC